MFKKTVVNPQLDMFDTPNMHLGERAYKKYSDPKSWHNQFYSLITSRIDEEIFQPLFPQGKKSGRPTASIRILVAMSVLKEGFGCSDEDLFEKCEFDLLTRKALGLLSLDDAPPSLDTYYLFRRRLCNYAETNNVDLIGKCFEHLVGDHIRLLKISGKCIRMDSKLIGSNIAKVTRYELIHHTTVRFLKGADLTILSEALNQKAREYLDEDSGKTVYRSDKDTLQSRLNDFGEFIYALLSVYGEDYAGVTLLKRLFDEQYVVEDSKVKLRDKKTISSGSLQSPDDPDATFRNKNGQKVSGFVTNITETVEEGKPSIITSVQTEPLTCGDCKFLQDAVKRTEQICGDAVEEIYADGAYQSPDNRIFAKEEGIALKTGKMQGASRYLLQRENGTDEVWVTDTLTGQIEKAVCTKGVKRGKLWRIPMPDTKVSSKFRYFTEKEVECSEIRQELLNFPPEELTKRNNVEAAMFQYSFHTRNGKTRYRGLRKHRIHAFCRCLWMNLRRIVIFFNISNLDIKQVFTCILSLFYIRNLFLNVSKGRFWRPSMQSYYELSFTENLKTASF